MPSINLDLRAGLGVVFFVAVVAAVFIAAQYDARFIGFAWAAAWLFTAAGPLRWFETFVLHLFSYEKGSPLLDLPWAGVPFWAATVLGRWTCVGIGAYETWHTLADIAASL